jgi:hypothetical protein
VAISIRVQGRWLGQARLRPSFLAGDCDDLWTGYTTPHRCPELAECLRLPLQPIDLRTNRYPEDRTGGVPPELAELVLYALLGLRRNVPTSPFPLEFGDELSGYAHLGMIGKQAGPCHQDAANLH